MTFTGMVIPPGILNAKVDLGDKPLVVTIGAVQHSAGDDCVFVRCVYPDDMMRHHQLFLTDSTDKLHGFMVQVFQAIYGQNVVPMTPFSAPFDALPGATVKFKEV